MKYEHEMTAPIQSWIEARGMVAYTEVPYYYSAIDHVGVNWDTRGLVLIETKLSLSRAVVCQANIKRMLGDAYVAVASRPRKASIESATQAGLGVLRVTESGCEELAPPGAKLEHPVYASGRDTFIEILRQLEPGGTGGLACLKGRGPAQDVHKAIQQHLDENPSATWRELYRDVPNHYASYRSLQSSMKVLENFSKAEPLRRTTIDTARAGQRSLP
ncbi:hypothetical protein LCGC14_0568610 [marine sediment metagenome]|uniref:Uncharacterized protein n=1 Tax=marine sediment metagenome TaxID=412755 RepID=A0A0F9RJV0_9ZZZZ|nr:hypothetical protein [Phycisphaerae bacterium]